MATKLTKERAKELFEQNLAARNITLADEKVGFTILDIKGMTKRFSTINPGQDEIAFVSKNPSFPGIFAISLDNVGSKFMKDGLREASSTYIKIPVTFELVRFSDWSREHLSPAGVRSYGMKFLDTEEAVEEWFEKLDAEIPIWLNQHKKCSEALKYIKEHGKEYKDIMKAHSSHSTEWKQAREAYEHMITLQMTKIAKRDALQQEARKGLA